MATYFVRKTGLDSNDGLSKGAAFLTIDKAANTVAAADTVYVGAGVYRETVTMDTSGTSGNIISYIADVDGSNTDDPGLVIISAYANELSGATRSSCWNPNGKEFITVQGFTMTGGNSGAPVYDAAVAGNRAYEETTFQDCVLLSGADGSFSAVILELNEGATPTTAGLTFQRCIIEGALEILYDENATAEVNCKMVIDSCLFLGNGSTGPDGFGFNWNVVSLSTFHVAGVAISNCIFVRNVEAVRVDDITPASPTLIVTVRNCLFYRCQAGLHKVTANDGLLTSDYNTFASTAADYTNVTTGGNDRGSNNTDPGLFGGLGDFTLYRFLGWSPYRPWEPIRLQDDAYIHSVIGDANTADAPAFDLYNEDRPMYGTVDDRGAVEGRARPEQETTTVRTGSNAVRFEGAGFHDFLIPVKAQAVTVSIFGRFDSNYTGSKPILEVLNIDGVADQSDIMTGAANTWEEVTATFTPTADGVCRVRVRSQDTSATGEAFFDDLTVV